MKTINPETQKIWDTLTTVAAKTLDRKRRLGEYAVVWQDNKPVIIGTIMEKSDDDFIFDYNADEMAEIFADVNKLP